LSKEFNKRKPASDLLENRGVALLICSLNERLAAEAPLRREMVVEEGRSNQSAVTTM